MLLGLDPPVADEIRHYKACVCLTLCVRRVLSRVSWELFAGLGQVREWPPPQHVCARLGVPWEQRMARGWGTATLARGGRPAPVWDGCVHTCACVCLCVHARPGGGCGTHHACVVSWGMGRRAGTQRQRAVPICWGV